MVDIRARCPVCGDVMGVYEPLVKVIDRAWHVTSFAAESLEDVDMVVHRDCAARLPAWPDEQSG